MDFVEFISLLSSAHTISQFPPNYPSSALDLVIVPFGYVKMSRIYNDAALVEALKATNDAPPRRKKGWTERKFLMAKNAKALERYKALTSSTPKGGPRGFMRAVKLRVNQSHDPKRCSAHFRKRWEDLIAEGAIPKYDMQRKSNHLSAAGNASNLLKY